MSESQLKELVDRVVEKEKFKDCGCNEGDKKKATLTIEEQKNLIKESFNLVTENTYYGEENINELFDIIHEKAIDLDNKGVSEELLEEGIMDFLGDALGRTFSGGFQAMAEKGLSWLMNRLPLIGQLPKGVKDALIIGIPNLFKKHGSSSFTILMNPSKYCNEVADWITDTLREFLLNKGLPKLGFESGTIRNMVDDIINDGFQGGQDEMNASICEKIKAYMGDDSVIDKAKEAGSEQIKTSIDKSVDDILKGVSDL